MAEDLSNKEGLDVQMGGDSEVMSEEDVSRLALARVQRDARIKAATIRAYERCDNNDDVKSYYGDWYYVPYGSDEWYYGDEEVEG